MFEGEIEADEYYFDGVRKGIALVFIRIKFNFYCCNVMCFVNTKGRFVAIYYKYGFIRTR